VSKHPPQWSNVACPFRLCGSQRHCPAVLREASYLDALRFRRTEAFFFLLADPLSYLMRLCYNFFSTLEEDAATLPNSPSIHASATIGSFLIGRLRSASRPASPREFPATRTSLPVGLGSSLPLPRFQYTFVRPRFTLLAPRRSRRNTKTPLSLFHY